jgi:predicted house-cleaning noncanonical NTP pyrophosphatase (MazG superfamily)
MSEKSKLVRDRIPELFGQDGAGTLLAVRHLEGPEYLAALLAKLGEEANEVRSASSIVERIAELADVAEVIRALTLVLTTPEHLEEVRQAKAVARGTFADRVWMTWEDDTL